MSTKSSDHGATMKIDLKADAKVIEEHLKERIAEYPVYINNGPGEDEDPIALITFGFSVDQAGWIALVFDTREDAEPDGEWNDFIEETWLEFPNWSDAIDTLFDKEEPIEIVLPNGKTKKNVGGEELVKQVGEMLKHMLINARKNKLFQDLPLAERSCMVVEEQLGDYGWPNFDARFKDGRVV